MYIIPVMHDVYYSCWAAFGMMYIIPVWHDVYYSCLAWCILFLYCLMYIIPVWYDVPYSQLPCCALFCCRLIRFICFFKLARCILFPYSMSYLILVYTNPISEILDVVCYSDVYSSAPPLDSTYTYIEMGRGCTIPDIERQEARVFMLRLSQLSSDKYRWWEF